jgi:hypothetical protein
MMPVMRIRLALLALAAVAALAGCGGGTRAARPAHAPAAAATPLPSAPPKPHARRLVFLSRNSWDAVPEEVAVYADGSVRYRQLLHTRTFIPTRAETLSARALRRIEHLVATAGLRGARSYGTPPRSGFRYLLRIGHRSVTTADGHLTPGVRPLIRRLGRLQDHMLTEVSD